MEDRPTDWGEISVRLRTSADSHWIEVQDNGIGMPPQVLAGPLLDFGISFWDSRLALELLPGIHAKGFEPTGKYGIGFFSVFMWGDEVTVISRPYAQSQSETRALEFRHGVFETPLLRPARADEILQDGGTLVRVKLAKDPLSPDGLLCPEGPDSAWALPELVAWLCPALDVTVSCLDEQGHRVAAVSASDWLILEGETLVKRVSYPRVLREEPNASGFEKKMRRYADRRLESLALLGQNLRIIKDTDGSPLGRACIAPGLRGASMWIAGRPLSAGVVVAGGLRATALGGIAGVLQGSCVEATRQAAIPDVDSATLAEWATEQALLLANSITDQEDLMEGAAVVHMCGGSTGPLPIATSADGAITATGIAAWAEAKREVLLVHEAAVSLATERHPGLVLDPDVLVIDSGPPTLLNRGGFYRPAARRFEFWPNQRRHESADAGWHWPLLPTALKGLVITLLARAWGLSLSAVLKSSLFGDDDTEYVRRVGKSEAGVLEEDVDVIRRAERRV
jgi:hypothetical protein